MYRRCLCCTYTSDDLGDTLVDSRSGDSYTTTGFNATTGPQPSAFNPLGNPTYPGYTSSNGPNWIDYLTVKYNSSLVETYNLAYGGATVDSALAVPYLPTVLSLQQQVQSEFIPIYTGADKVTTWDATTSLFVLWFGINDVGNTYASTGESNYSTVYSAILTQYAIQVSDLYTLGARNFLFMNVPPVNRSPLTTAQGANYSTLEAAAISTFNAGIASLASNLTLSSRESGSPAEVFLFDAHTLFGEVLDNPASFPETAGYKNTTAYCAAYANGTPTPTTFNASCGIPVNEYFWLNTLHPTYPMHDLLARKVVELLT